MIRRDALRPDAAGAQPRGGRVKSAAPLGAAGAEPRAARPSRASMASTRLLMRPSTVAQTKQNYARPLARSVSLLWWVWSGHAVRAINLEEGFFAWGAFQ